MSQSKVKSGSIIGAGDRVAPYDAMVYKDGTYTIAIDGNGNVIKKVLSSLNTDDVAIQAAIDFINRSGVVQLSKGSYNINSTINIGNGNQYINLQIIGMSYIATPDVSINPVRIIGNGLTAFECTFKDGWSNNLILEGLKIDLTDKNNPASMGIVFVNHTYGIRIKDVSVVNAYTGLDFTGSVINIDIDSCQFFKCINGVIFSSGGWNNIVTINNSTFQACTTGLIFNRAYMNECINRTIFESCTVGVKLCFICNIAFNYCWFESNTNSDILLEDGSGWSSPQDSQDLVINGCFADNSSPDFITNSYYYGRLFRLRISNSYIEKTGKYITRSVNTAQWANASAMIFGGVFDNNRFSGTIHGFASRLNGSHVMTFINNTATTLSAGYGGVVPPYIQITGGSLSSNIFKKGTNATIAAGNTYVDVTHDLQNTPTKITVTPTTNIGTRSFWVDTKGASTFRININSSDSIDHTFDWEAEV